MDDRINEWAPESAAEQPNFRATEFILSSFFAELGETSFDPGDVAAERVQPGRLFELGAGLLQPQVENLLADVPAIGEQLRLGLFLNLFSLRFFHRCKELK